MLRSWLRFGEDLLVCYEAVEAVKMNIQLHDTVFPSYLILKVSGTEHVALLPCLQQ